jgi:hypothetical protein
MKPDERGEGGELPGQLGFDAVPALIPGNWPDPATLQHDELAVIALIDGTRPVSELLWLSGLSATVTQQVLWSLCERGIVAALPGASRADSGAAGESARTPVSFVESPEALVARTGLTQDVAEVPARAAIPRVGGYQLIARFAQDGWGVLHVAQRGDARELPRLLPPRLPPQAGGPAWGPRLFLVKTTRQGPEPMQGLLREAEIGARLVHPNALSVLEVGRYQGQLFLVFDLVDGASLDDLLVEGQPADPGAVVAVLVDVLRALQAAHDLADDQGQPLGLVHGAVSPACILVGTDGAARLTGFGRARFFARPNDPAEGPSGASAWSGQGEQAGAWSGRAPEQLAGAPCDGRADLFAVGAVMWTALTGQPLPAESRPGPGGEPPRKPLPAPSNFGAPRSLDAICLRALSPAPEARYRSADEMARALLQVALAEGLLAGGREVGIWVRRAAGDQLADRQQRIRAARTAQTAPAASARETLREGMPPAAQADRPAARVTTAEMPSPVPLSRLPLVGVPYVAEASGEETTAANRRRATRRRVQVAAMVVGVSLALAGVATLLVRLAG